MYLSGGERRLCVGGVEVGVVWEVGVESARGRRSNVRFVRSECRGVVCGGELESRWLGVAERDSVVGCDER